VKRLFLLRHAKAQGALPDGEDATRALVVRGLEDATRLGRFLKSKSYACDQALCSTARRARDTLEAVLQESRARPKVRFLHDLYLADSKTIIAIVRRIGDGTETLMIAAHNPGLEECARQLTGAPQTPTFPTCALAIIDFDVPHWRAIAPGGGVLERFVRPRDLIAE
jgi:phosphohistidine phosphatase